MHPGSFPTPGQSAACLAVDGAWTARASRHARRIEQGRIRKPRGERRVEARPPPYPAARPGNRGASGTIARRRRRRTPAAPVALRGGRGRATSLTSDPAPCLLGWRARGESGRGSRPRRREYRARVAEEGRAVPRPVAGRRACGLGPGTRWGGRRVVRRAPSDRSRGDGAMTRMIPAVLLGAASCPRRPGARARIASIGSSIASSPC